MQFDAGAIAFRLMMVGKQAFLRDQADVDKAIDQTGKTAKDAKGKLDDSGKSTDELGKKARAAKKPLDDQAKSTDEVGKKSQESAKKQREQAQAAEEQKRAAEDIGRALLTVGAAITAVVGLAVAGSAQFDQAMSQTSAAIMATRAEQEALSESALRAGQDTAYSATEAAAAQEELAKAGLSVTEVIGGGLNGALALAAAGQLEVARSAEIMATTLKQYNLEADQAGHVSDLLAAGAGKAQGSVEDLGLALSYAGPVAAGLGVSIEETTGVLALFASRGILADRAGTGLRGMLMSLTSPSQIAARTMKEYGIEVFNADGSMKSMAEVADELQSAMGHLTEAERSQALGRIFGNEQITTARILYEGGAAAVQDWTAQVNDAGYAERQAAMRTDNLIGDLERLGGAFETALIKSGSGANDVLRGLVQSAEGAVDWFGQLPDPVQQTALGLGVALGAMALFSGGAITLVGKLGEIKQNLDLMNTSMRRTALVGAGVGLALTGVIAVVGILAAEHAEAQARAEEYADALRAGGDAAEKFVAEQLAMKDSFLWMDRGSAVENAEKLGISLEEVTDAVKGTSAEYEAFKERVMEAYAEAGKTLDAGYAMEQLLNKVEALREAESEAERQIEDTAEAQDSLNGSNAEGADVAESAAEAYLEEAGALDDLNTQLDELIAKIMESNDANQDAITANADYEASLDAVEEQIRLINEGAEGYARTLDLTTEAGRENMAMLQDQARDSQAAAEAQFELDGNTDAYIQRLKDGRQTFIENAQRLGATKAEAEALADQIYQIPSEKEIEILAETSRAQAEIDYFMRMNSNRTVYIHTAIAQGARVGVGGVTHYEADGGVVSFHANGSISENRVAQIARAGDWRVWAEPETGGEAYIPLSPTKRARSEMIMAETARRLGGVYIPSGARAFADGGVVAAPVPAGAAPLIGNLTLQSTGNLRDDLSEVNFWVRKLRRGGRRG